MTKALNSSRFSLLSRYYKELTKKEKERKDIIEKMKKHGKNMRSEIIMEKIKKKTEKGGEILFEHINQIMTVTEKFISEKKPKSFQGIISASDDKSLILWDKEYKQKSTQKRECGYIKLIELSSGEIAATTWNPDNSVEILGNNLEVLCTLSGHTDTISDICNMGESHVITGSSDYTVRMWDVISGECIQIIQGHTNTVNCVHLHSSGYLLTGSFDQTVRIWDITTPYIYKSISQIPHEDADVMDLVELDAGRMLSVCGGSQSLGVKVWVLRWNGTGNILENVPTPEQEGIGFRCGLWIAGTKGVLLGGFGGNLMLFDVTSYALSPLIDNLHRTVIAQIKELKDDIYVTCSMDKSIKIVNVVTRNVLQTLLGHTGSVLPILPIFAEE